MSHDSENRRRSLFEFAGGEQALHSLEQIFYESVLVDPLLAPLFGEGKPTHVEHLTMFTAESFGKADMPSDPAFREAFREHIEFGSHVAMQNSNAETDDQLHPLREVPHWTRPGESGER